MKFTGLMALALAIAFTGIVIAFAAQSVKIGGISALPLCKYAFLWLIAASTSWAFIASRLVKNNL